MKSPREKYKTTSTSERFDDVPVGECFRLSVMGQVGPTLFEKIEPVQEHGQLRNARSDGHLFRFLGQVPVVTEPCHTLTALSSR